MNKLGQHTEYCQKNLKITTTAVMIKIDLIGMTLAEIRWDLCGLPVALRIVAQVIESHEDIILVYAKDAEKS